MAGLRKQAPKKVAPKKDAVAEAKEELDVEVEEKTQDEQDVEVKTAIEQDEEISEAEAEDKEVDEIKPSAKELKESEQAKPKGEPMVKVKLRREIRTTIGSSFYSFRKGEITTVPRNVKEILMNAGYLEAI